MPVLEFKNYKIEHFFIELTMITGQVIENIFLVCELMERAIFEARQTIVLSTHIWDQKGFPQSWKSGRRASVSAWLVSGCLQLLQSGEKKSNPQACQV